HVNIEINDRDMAEAIVGTRHFTNAVEAVVENMDLNDILDAPSRSDVEIIVEDMGVPTSDDVCDIAREVVWGEVSGYLSSSEGKQVLRKVVEEVLEDLGISRTPQVPLQTQARLLALAANVAQIQTVLRDVANALSPKPNVPQDQDQG